MSSLSFDTLELVSTERVVPLNGSPSSQDYNDTQNENLSDHATIAQVINDVIRPVLLSLPSSASSGLEGRTIFTDITDQSGLCFNSLTAAPLTIAQSLQYLQSIVLSVQGQQQNINTQVGILNMKLSSTNQNDIALALQNFQSMLNQQAAVVANMVLTVSRLAPSTALVVLPSNPVQAVDCKIARVQKIVLTADTHISFINATPSDEVTVIVAQDGSGGHAITWDTSIQADVDMPMAVNTSVAFKFLFDGVNYLLLNSPINNNS